MAEQGRAAVKETYRKCNCLREHGVSYSTGAVKCVGGGGGGGQRTRQKRNLFFNTHKIICRVAKFDQTRT